MSEPQKYLYVVHIGAPAERVWQALTEGSFTRRYFHCTEIKSSWVPGTEVLSLMPDGSVAARGRVLEVVRPRRLMFTWSPQYSPELAAEKPSRVTFELEEASGVTRLSLTHDDFQPDSKVYLHVVGGWSAILSSLKTLLETGEPLPIAGNERT